MWTRVLGGTLHMTMATSLPTTTSAPVQPQPLRQLLCRGLLPHQPHPQLVSGLLPQSTAQCQRPQQPAGSGEVAMPCCCAVWCWAAPPLASQACAVHHPGLSLWPWMTAPSMMDTSKPCLTMPRPTPSTSSTSTCEVEQTLIIKRAFEVCRRQQICDNCSRYQQRPVISH